ncbi:hypothetical protein CANMA_003922 [Candida margitis]|uniref:uncharacterized protein n=1 Tax=Candida margitis TaxID=1775924 RepID=UPI0022271CEE|nr:uncharacterized protein CANMA_003922 [Candida margitis]KAI5961148.1 hypothetical protein CANMA_003922 [Candida margitis]
MRYSTVILTLVASSVINAAPLAVRDDATPSHDQTSFAGTPTTAEPELPTTVASDSTVASGSAVDAVTSFESTTSATSLITDAPTEDDDPRTNDPNFWSSMWGGYAIDDDGNTLSAKTTFDPYDGTWSYHRRFYITRSPLGVVGKMMFLAATKKDDGSEEDEYVEAVPTYSA